MLVSRRVVGHLQIEQPERKPHYWHHYCTSEYFLRPQCDIQWLKLLDKVTRLFCSFKQVRSMISLTDIVPLHNAAYSFFVKMIIGIAWMENVMGRFWLLHCNAFKVWQREWTSGKWSRSSTASYYVVQKMARLIKITTANKFLRFNILCNVPQTLCVRSWEILLS